MNVVLERKYTCFTFVTMNNFCLQNVVSRELNQDHRALGEYETISQRSSHKPLDSSSPEEHLSLDLST